MIHLAEDHYAAIGRVAVESCTLDREVGEYLTELGSPPPARTMIGRKMTLFQNTLKTQKLTSAGIGEFESAVRKVRRLIDLRNALAHGVWVPDLSSTHKLASIAHGENATVHASEVAEVAAKLRVARKLLLRLCQDHLPKAAGKKKKISASAARLAQQL